MFTTDATVADALLNVPQKYELTAVVGFGYPTREVKGIRDRKPLVEAAFGESFGSDFDLEDGV